MLELCLSTKFKKDLKKIRKQNKDTSKLDKVVYLLQTESTLPKKLRDHELIGNWKGYRECDMSPDRLLIYKKKVCMEHHYETQFLEMRESLQLFSCLMCFYQKIA